MSYCQFCGKKDAQQREPDGKWACEQHRHPSYLNTEVTHHWATGRPIEPEPV